MRRYAVLHYPVGSALGLFGEKATDAYRIIRTDDGALWNLHLNVSSTSREEIAGLVRLLNADEEEKAAIAFRSEIEGEGS